MSPFSRGGQTLFGFEHSYASTLEWIPMVVRFRLDLCGIKLSLKQWQKFTLAQRERLVHATADSPQSLADFEQYLTGLIEVHSGEPADRVPVDPEPAWNDTSRVPPRLLECALKAGLLPPALERWAALGPLERFCLVKLTRADHDSENFLPAMRELGLASTP